MPNSLVELPSLAPKRLGVLGALGPVDELLAVVGVAQAVVVDHEVVRLLTLADELLVLLLRHLLVHLVVVVLGQEGGGRENGGTEGGREEGEKAGMRSE